MRFHSRCTSCIVAHLAIYIMLERYDVCIKVAFNENVQGDVMANGGIQITVKWMVEEMRPGLMGKRLIKFRMDAD